MKRKSRSLMPWVLAGGAILGYMGMKKLLDWQPGADAGFFDWSGPVSKEQVGAARFDLPIRYYRDDSFMAIFSAAYEPVCALLPSLDLYPVRLPGNRAAVAIIAFNYLDTSIGPYGEVGIAIPCTYLNPAPPLLPILLEDKWAGWGGFVLHLPVTSIVARDAGRGIWGYAKFVADMDFEKRPAYQRVRLAEGGADILTLTVRQSGIAIKDNRPLITYSVRDGRLLKTVVPSRAVYQVGLTPGCGVVELGDHAIAHQLRDLDLSSTALATKNYLARYGILPAPEAIGPADSSYTGYAGEDREYGRLTVCYDDTSGPIDLYAGVRKRARSRV